MAEQQAQGFQFEGVKYEFQGLMLAEARDVQKVTGMTVAEWEDAVNKADAYALTALIWVARRRNGETSLRFDAVDGDLSTFVPYLDEPAAAEGEPGKELAAEGDDSTAGPSSAEA